MGAFRRATGGYGGNVFAPKMTDVKSEMARMGYKMVSRRDPRPADREVWVSDTRTYFGVCVVTGQEYPFSTAWVGEATDTRGVWYDMQKVFPKAADWPY